MEENNGHGRNCSLIKYYDKTHSILIIIYNRVLDEWKIIGKKRSYRMQTRIRIINRT